MEDQLALFHLVCNTCGEFADSEWVDKDCLVWEIVPSNYSI